MCLFDPAGQGLREFFGISGTGESTEADLIAGVDLGGGFVGTHDEALQLRVGYPS